MRPDGPHVLVIDDDSNSCTLIKLLLDYHGYRTTLAADGEVGLALAEIDQPDIILLDVAMPRRHGWDVYLDLQDRPGTSGIPVIVCSAALTAREVSAWQALPYVAQVMIKPFDIYALVARINDVLLTPL